VVVLIGFMGAGKSTIGPLVADQLGVPFVDVDDEIERRLDMTIGEIFEARGEEGFRSIEREVTLDVLRGRRAVVAMGGGATSQPAIAEALRGSFVVHLKVSCDTALARARDGRDRPLLRSGDPGSLWSERQPVYDAVASLAIDTEGRDPSAIAAAIARSVGGGRIERVPVKLPGRSYEVLVGDGAIERLGDVVDLGGVEKALLVVDPEVNGVGDGVASELDRLGIQVRRETVPRGEGAKQLTTAARLWGSLVSLEAHRNDLVIAVGGGATSDVAGFVASTYMRGLPFVCVPTTLLGQVDAAIGGKNALNVEDAKNLIGTIHQPLAVVADVAVLRSLPQEEFASGMAEVLQYGFIRDTGLLFLVEDRAEEIIARSPETLVDVVARCASIKADVVGLDEAEAGERAVLNYGHTFAHAIEKVRG
jgi:3-dehydroquinate synthase/shikimate kinase/3-dehydroquinate synthase